MDAARGRENWFLAHTHNVRTVPEGREIVNRQIPPISAGATHRPASGFPSILSGNPMFELTSLRGVTMAASSSSQAGTDPSVDYKLRSAFKTP